MAGRDPRLFRSLIASLRFGAGSLGAGALAFTPLAQAPVLPFDGGEVQARFMSGSPIIACTTTEY